MKKLLVILALLFILVGPSYTADENTVTIVTTKVTDLFTNITEKYLQIVNIIEGKYLFLFHCNYIKRLNIYNILQTYTNV